MVGFLVGFLLTACHVFGCWWAYTGFRALESGDGWMLAFYGDDLPTNAIIYTDVVYYTLVTMTSVGCGQPVYRMSAAALSSHFRKVLETERGR